MTDPTTPGRTPPRGTGRRRGRPPEAGAARDVTVHIRLTPEERARLRAVTDTLGVSVSDLMRAWIAREYAELGG